MTTGFSPLRDGKHSITPTQLAGKIGDKLRRNKEKGHQVINPLAGSNLGGEVEIATAHLIFFCKKRGEGWKPLTLSELLDGTHDMRLDPPRSSTTCAYVLVNKGWLVREGKTYENSQFYFTAALIEACDKTLDK